MVIKKKENMTKTTDNIKVQDEDGAFMTVP